MSGGIVNLSNWESSICQDARIYVISGPPPTLLLPQYMDPPNSRSSRFLTCLNLHNLRMLQHRFQLFRPHISEKYFWKIKANFQLFFIISPWKKVWPFIFTTLNFLHLIILCKKFVVIGSMVLEKSHWISHLERDWAHASKYINCITFT